MIVPAVISFTEMPTTRPMVKSPFISGRWKAVFAAKSALIWSGWWFIVRQLKRTLSISVSVRPEFVLDDFTHDQVFIILAAHSYLRFTRAYHT